MAKPRITVAAGEVVREFSHYSDVALVEPVIVTKNGRPRNVLISFDEFERLRRRDQHAFTAAETPEKFLAGIEALADGTP